MDIEALRKINALTGALRSHGAASSEEALKQAEHILQPLHTNPTETTGTQQSHETGGNTALLERKYQLLLEMNTKKFEQTILALQEQISQLTNDVGRLRKTLQHKHYLHNNHHYNSKHHNNPHHAMHPTRSRQRHQNNQHRKKTATHAKETLDRVMFL